MTMATEPSLDFDLPPELEAHEPPEARGLARDGVRLLTSRSDRLDHGRFTDLPEQLEPGDVLVVNTTATMPAAVDLPDSERTVHFSTLAQDGTWIVELRHGSEPDPTGTEGERIALPGRVNLVLLRRHASRRLWHASLSTPDVPTYLARFGRPIRYGYVAERWPIESYQTAFATAPGSAEMPSAGRPFTPELVTRLVSRGVLIVPLTLHTGVASPEFHEPPYAEWFEVPEVTARVVNDAKLRGARVVAVGTTAVRALESTTTSGCWVEPASGWTELVITPERGVCVVSGLLTGFHEPKASHLLMLEAIAGQDLVRRSYEAALERRYLWHEFGDLNLLLP